MRFWYLSYIQTVKIKARLRKCAVWSELSLLTHKYGCRGRLGPNFKDFTPPNNCTCVFKEQLYTFTFSIPELHKLSKLRFYNVRFSFNAYA